jgi:hypothetical protein
MKRVSIFSLLFMLSLTYISCSTNKSGISENSSSSIDDNIQAAIYDTTLAADTTKAKKLIRQQTIRQTDATSDNYWYYIRSGTGGFYDFDTNTMVYSQILTCSQRVTTPGYFSKNDGVGPFDTFSQAQQARNSDLDIALRSGKKLAQRTATCDTRWL